MQCTFSARRVYGALYYSMNLQSAHIFMGNQFIYGLSRARSKWRVRDIAGIWDTSQILMSGMSKAHNQRGKRAPIKPGRQFIGLPGDFCRDFHHVQHIDTIERHKQTVQCRLWCRKLAPNHIRCEAKCIESGFDVRFSPSPFPLCSPPYTST